MKNKSCLYVIGILFATVLFSCKNKVKNDQKNTEMTELSEEERYRPNFHFTPKSGWMNDPNGLFYYNNYYHLYFQHYPDGNTWGPMHWGHATSTDLISWKEQPIALYPDELGYIFSGSAVVDHENTSGFGENDIVPIIAMFTYHDPKKDEAKESGVQTQGIAFSLDEGLTWTKYKGNPVIESPGIRDFRDPKVTWDDIHKQWNMVLAAGQETFFYSSQNLKDWKMRSRFGEGIGNHDGVWECPDLFPLKVRGSEEIKWVHLVSINPGGPNGGSATQYFIGDFDGKQFTVDKDFKAAMAKEHDFWADFGKDNYAGVTWSNVATSKGDKLFIGWMSNWQYANEVPTETWRSATTIARELSLLKIDGNYRLAFEPTKEIDGYHGKKYKKDGISVKGETKLLDAGQIDLSRAEIRFDIADNASKTVDFTLSNAQGDSLLFGFDGKNGQFYVDRTRSGKIGFDEEFAASVSTAPRISDAAVLSGRIILDKTSIELFFDDGLNVMTEIFFPNAPFERLSVTSDAERTLEHFEIHELNSN